MASSAQTQPPGRPTQRPLGRDMNQIRLKIAQGSRQAAIGEKFQFDFGIRRQRKAQPARGIRSHDAEFMAEALQILDRRLQSSHHAIDLRMPSIGDDKDFHGWALFWLHFGMGTPFLTFCIRPGIAFSLWTQGAEITRSRLVHGMIRSAFGAASFAPRFAKLGELSDVYHPISPIVRGVSAKGNATA